MASDLPTLTARNRRGTSMFGTFTDGVTRYEQEWLEGPSTASWRFVAGERGIVERDLLHWFNTRLGAQVRATHRGACVWEGYVWEMTLLHAGMIYTKSLTGYASSVVAAYRDANNDTQYSTPQVNVEAANQYWQKEEIIDLFTGTTTTGEDEPMKQQANERAAAWLERVSSPYTQPPAYTTETGAWLDVSCGGRIVVANNRWMYPYAEGDEWGDETTVSDEIRRIVEDYMPTVLVPVEIADNATPTKIGVNTRMRAFDRLRELAQLRDPSGNHYELVITPGPTPADLGSVIYRQVDTTPRYLRLPGRGIETPAGDVPTWDARPGVIRNLDVFSGPSLPDTWLSDQSLSYAERVTMRQGDEVASFAARDVGIADIYAAMDANLRWVEYDKNAQWKSHLAAEAERERKAAL